MQLGQQEAWLHRFFHLPPGRRRSCLIGVTNTLFRLIQEQLRPAPTWHLSGSEPRAKAILKCNRLNGHMFRSGTWCVRAHWKRALPVAPRPNSPPGLLLPEENKVKTWPPSASVADRWQMCDAVTTVHAAGVGGWGGGFATAARQTADKVAPNTLSWDVWSSFFTGRVQRRQIGGRQPPVKATTAQVSLLSCHV